MRNSILICSASSGISYSGSILFKSSSKTLDIGSSSSQLSQNTQDSVSRANFPSYWKFAMIRPISKAGSKKYRPIYLLRQPRRKSLRKLSHGFSKADPVVQNSQPLARIAKLIAITLYPHPKARKLFVSSSIYSKLLQSHRCVRFHGFFATFVPVPTS